MDTLKIATYGRWNSGKTTQIQFLIDAFGKENVWIVSCDDGLSVVEGMYAPEQRVVANNTDALRKAWGTIHAAVKDKPESWVCFDGMTAAAERIEDYMFSKLDECAKTVAVKGKNAVDDDLREYLRFLNDQGGIDTMKAYRSIGTSLKLMIDSWTKQMPCNVYATMHEQETTRDRASGPPLTPKLPGNVAREYVMGAFSFVLRMKLDKGHCIAQLDPERMGQYWSRTRKNNERMKGPMPKEIVGFNLAEFVGLVRGEAGNGH